MKLVTYNVKGCVHGVDWVGGVVRDIAADVACLQEVKRAHIAKLEQLTSRRSVFFASRRFSGFGNAIFARERPEVTVRLRFARHPGLERRSMVAARIGEVTVATTHLGLVGDERVQHAREIEAAVVPHVPLIVAGDFNEEPDAAAVSVLRAHLHDAFSDAGTGKGNTFPAVAADRRIDLVLYRGLTVISAEVVAVNASDHRPLVVELSL
ncbi:MAG: hypothetical protein NVSMB57_16290 [Actinomycetota bacterium]